MYTIMGRDYLTVLDAMKEDYTFEIDRLTPTDFVISPHCQDPECELMHSIWLTPEQLAALGRELIAMAERA